MATILIVDDQPVILDLVKSALRDEGHDIVTIESPVGIEHQIDALDPDLILLDRMANSFNSFDLLLELKLQYPKLPVMVYILQKMVDLDRLKQSLAYALQGNFHHYLAF